MLNGAGKITRVADITTAVNRRNKDDLFYA